MALKGKCVCKACQVHTRACCGGFEPVWLRPHYRNMTLDWTWIQRSRARFWLSIAMLYEMTCSYGGLQNVLYINSDYTLLFFFLHSIFNPTSSLCRSLFCYESQFCSLSHSYTPPVPANRGARIHKPFIFSSPQDPRSAKMFGTSLQPRWSFMLSSDFNCNAVNVGEQWTMLRMGYHVSALLCKTVEWNYVYKVRLVTKST